MSILDTIVPIDPLSAQREAELVVAYCSGDKEAGNLLIRSQIKWIHSLCCRVCRKSHVSVEEIMSDVFLDVVEALPRYNPDEGRLITFLTPVVLKSGKRYLSAHADSVSGRKRPQGKTQNEIQAVVVQDAAVYDDDWYESLDDISQHLHESIEMALGSAIARDVFKRRMEGRGACEIASELSITPANVRDILLRIAASVLVEMSFRGVDNEDFVSRKTIKALKPLTDVEKLMRRMGMS